MINVVIPMAGRGSRFEQAGFTFPKPLIEVFCNNQTQPMIQMIVENLNIKANYIFLVLKEHYDKYSLKYLLPLICKENTCDIVIVDSVTEGAACTILLAKDFVNNDDELIIANSDQWMDWNSEDFINFLHSNDADGGICTFIATHSKWSFVKLNGDIITEVAEKKPISNVATCGVYYFKNGHYFVSSAEEMILNNDRVNNEFYIAPTFNYLIKKNKLIYNYPVKQMLGTGTPEDLKIFMDMQRNR